MKEVANISNYNYFLYYWLLFSINQFKERHGNAK